jgi:hypothetical protein
MDAEIPAPVDQNKNSSSPQKNQPKKGVRLVGVLLIFLLLAGLLAGVWFYQQSKIDDLQKSVSSLTAEKKKAIDDLAALNQKNDDEKQNKVVVTYSGVIKDTDDRYGSSGGQANGTAELIIVQFTAENKGTGAQALKASDFDLKTSAGTVATKYADSAEAIGAVKAFSLPDNLSAFSQYSLKPGEKVNGALVYWNTNKTATGFTITYVSASKDLVVTKTTRVCTREGTTCH